MSVLLNISDLSVKYDGTGSRALQGVGFSVESGERVALIGANGAGKSTLLLTLTGVLQPDEGEILIDGIQLAKKTVKRLREKTGMLFQNPDDQLFMPTVYDDIAFGPRNLGLEEHEINTRVNGSLEALGIAGLRGRMTHRLSGGEKRLTALAGVLVMDPPVLLADEPSSFLDPRARRRLIEILLGLKQAMLIATHDLDLARRVCSRAIALKEGAVYADAPIDEILDNDALLYECGL